MEFIDQLNNVVTLSKTPSRIVSLVPSQTELLVDLGLRENIVGITKFCIHPSDLRNEKTMVGGTKKVNFKKIKALKPDLIICNKEENTETMVRQLEIIAPVWVSDVNTIADCVGMIEKLGEVLNVLEKALTIVSKIKKELKEFEFFIEDKLPKKTLYLIWKDPFMAVGKPTFIDALLHLNKFENSITDEVSRYPEIDLVLFNKVDLILLSTEPYPFKESHVLNLQAEVGTNVSLVDGEYFSWYGTRLIKAFEYFKTLHTGL